MISSRGSGSVRPNRIVKFFVKIRGKSKESEAASETPWGRATEKPKHEKKKRANQATLTFFWSQVHFLLFFFPLKGVRADPMFLTKKIRLHSVSLKAEKERNGKTSRKDTTIRKIDKTG